MRELFRNGIIIEFALLSILFVPFSAYAAKGNSNFVTDGIIEYDERYAGGEDQIVESGGGCTSIADGAQVGYVDDPAGGGAVEGVSSSSGNKEENKNTESGKATIETESHIEYSHYEDEGYAYTQDYSDGNSYYIWKYKDDSDSRTTGDNIIDETLDKWRASGSGLIESNSTRVGDDGNSTTIISTNTGYIRKETTDGSTEYFSVEGAQDNDIEMSRWKSILSDISDGNYKEKKTFDDERKKAEYTYETEDGDIIVTEEVTNDRYTYEEHLERYDWYARNLDDASEFGTYDFVLIEKHYDSGRGYFKHYFGVAGDHQAMVKTIFKVNVYHEWDEHRSTTWTDEEGKSHTDSWTVHHKDFVKSYLKEAGTEIFDFHIPLKCLECPDFKVCIGGGCDCANTTGAVCDDDHRPNLNIDSRTELVK